MTCSATAAEDVFRFRITDDVIRGRREQKKEGEEVQFDFNVKTDRLQAVVEDLVRFDSVVVN